MAARSFLPLLKRYSRLYKRWLILIPTTILFCHSFLTFHQKSRSQEHVASGTGDASNINHLPDQFYPEHPISWRGHNFQTDNLNGNLPYEGERTVEKNEHLPVKRAVENNENLPVKQVVLVENIDNLPAERAVLVENIGNLPVKRDVSVENDEHLDNENKISVENNVNLDIGRQVFGEQIIENYRMIAAGEKVPIEKLSETTKSNSNSMVMEKNPEHAIESENVAADDTENKQNVVDPSRNLDDAKNSEPIKKPKKADHLSTFKKILFYNDLYGNKNFHVGEGMKPFWWPECSHHSCFITSDRNMFESWELDAVLYHVNSDDNSIPPDRGLHTVYIAYMIEAPLYRYWQNDYRKFNNMFNWTVSYRRDSDIRLPYSMMVPGALSWKKPPLGKNFAAGKTKMAAWMVSHCTTNSGRETFVTQLQKYMSVDIYGYCGDKVCEKGKTCNTMVEKDYKFYLAFENSLCEDYVTEKVFRHLDLDVVPVVYGLGYESHGIPVDSYIDALQFESAKDLADYLHYLDGNDTAYNEYFRYKRSLHREDHYIYRRNTYCEICKRLHTMYPISEDGAVEKAVVNDDTRSYFKIYEDFHDWWETQSRCIVPTADPQLKFFVEGWTKSFIKAIGMNNKTDVMNIAYIPNFKWPKDGL